MKIHEGRNSIEWIIILGTAIIVNYLLYPLFFFAMAKDLKMDGLDLVVAARYLGISLTITLIGLTVGFEYMEEMRSDAISGRKGFRYSAETYIYGGFLILTVIGTVFLDGLAIWHYNIKEVNWQLGILILKSGIWQASLMIVTLGGAYLRDLERRRRVGSHAVKVKK
jgi:hypothetical protein